MIKNLTNFICRSTFFVNSSGATAIQYGLVAALLGMGIISSVTQVGNSNKNSFNGLSATLETGGTGDYFHTKGDADQLAAQHETHPTRGHAWYITSLEGWELGGAGRVDLETFVSRRYTAPEGVGEYFIDLQAGRGQNSSIATDVNIPPGDDYTLSFYANDHYQSAVMDVVVNGEVIDTISGLDRDFEQFEYTITGNSGGTPTNVQLVERGDPNDGAGHAVAGIKLEAAQG